jgi:2-isopropylmalate synthase
VGIKANNLVLGKHSGRHALADRARELGYELSSAELNRVFNEFKRLADKKKTVFDEDIEAIINQTTSDQGRFQFKSLNVTSGTESGSKATVEMDVDGKPVKESDTGVGTVDAAMNTIKKITGSQCKLTQYKVTAISGGTDAQGEVTVAIEDNGKSATGRAADLDIVVASAKAFIVALNRMSLRKDRVEGI